MEKVLFATTNLPDLWPRRFDAPVPSILDQAQSSVKKKWKQKGLPPATRDVVQAGRGDSRQKWS